jgi:hypothetical protein
MLLCISYKFVQLFILICTYLFVHYTSLYTPIFMISGRGGGHHRARTLRCLLLLLCHPPPNRLMLHLRYLARVKGRNKGSWEKYKKCRSENYELSLKCKRCALVEALSSVMNLGVLKVAQILTLGGMWAEIPYRMLDSLLSPTYCVHELVGP